MKGLLIYKKWIDKILDGSKTTEFRSRRTHIRGRILLLEVGSSLICGSVEIVDCVPHKRGFAWLLQNPIRFEPPISYHHPCGAQTWVNLSFS